MSKRIRVAVLGSTGSIGTQTLDIASKEGERIEIIALAAHSSWQTLVAQAKQFNVEFLACSDPKAAAQTQSELPAAHVGAGLESVVDLIERSNPDIVVNALVGAAGLRATIATLLAGKVLALANKESLVVGGDLVMPLATPETLLPVDSEHSAIYQCLLGENPFEVSKLWITASGGPFRGYTRAQLATVSASDALAHPTWKMGPKITVDSASLMNKGLEVIEAHHLFNMDYDQIEVVVHPQSCIHSMVEYCDGSVKAHLGVTDMRIPIQFALSYPSRWSAPSAPLDFRTLSDLTFEAPDTQTFPCLSLAYEAGRHGGSMPVVLNAANEVAVARFLSGGCAFLDIAHTVEHSMSRHSVVRLESVEHIEEIDQLARVEASAYVDSL